MLEQKEINKIKYSVEEFFSKSTITFSDLKIGLSSTKEKSQDLNNPTEDRDVVDIEIEIDEPQILIGQGGQTLFEIQRLLRAILCKKLQKVFYINLDINGYKKKKIEYLKNLARELADQASSNKEEKVLMPMSSYERRVVHAELSQRTDVTTESCGDGFDRHIVIKPK